MLTQAAAETPGTGGIDNLVHGNRDKSICDPWPWRVIGAWIVRHDVASPCGPCGPCQSVAHCLRTASHTAPGCCQACVRFLHNYQVMEGVHDCTVHTWLRRSPPGSLCAVSWSLMLLLHPVLVSDHRVALFYFFIVIFNPGFIFTPAPPKSPFPPPPQFHLSPPSLSRPINCASS